MRRISYLAVSHFLILGISQAGTVNFDSQAGAYFSFQNLTEDGPNVPPSRVESPSLFLSPIDTIQFKPSAFVAVESQMGSAETATLSSKLSFLIQATAALPMERIIIDVAGTYAEHSLTIPGVTPILSTSLSLDPIEFKIGGVTKLWNPSFSVSRNTADQTWSGRLEVTQGDLRDLFASPTMEVSQLEVFSTATVSASAQWGNASSYLTTLSFGVAPIPEPSTASLLLLSGLALLHKRRRSLMYKGLKININVK